MPLWIIRDRATNNEIGRFYAKPGDSEEFVVQQWCNWTENRSNRRNPSNTIAERMPSDVKADR